jgi:hypothetical protein
MIDPAVENDRQLGYSMPINEVRARYIRRNLMESFGD